MLKQIYIEKLSVYELVVFRVLQTIFPRLANEEISVIILLEESPVLSTPDCLDGYDLRLLVPS